MCVYRSAIDILNKSFDEMFARADLGVQGYLAEPPASNPQGDSGRYARCYRKHTAPGYLWLQSSWLRRTVATADDGAEIGCIRSRFSPTPLPFPLILTSSSLSAISCTLVQKLVPYSISIV